MTRILKRAVVLFSSLFFCAFPLRGQVNDVLHSIVYRDSLRMNFYKQCSVYFPLSKYDLDTAYLSNGDVLHSIYEDFCRLKGRNRLFPDTVFIRSTASPDGPARFNAFLAEQRGDALRSAVAGMMPELSGVTFIMESIPIDWMMVERITRLYEDTRDREEVLSIIHDPNLDDSVKKKRIKELRPFFRWIQNGFGYKMRSASLAYRVDPLYLTQPLSAVHLDYDRSVYSPSKMEICRPAALGKDMIPEELSRTRKMSMAFRTNLLLPLLNVGIEVPIGYHHSVGMDFYYPWWVAPGNNYCIQCLTLFLDYKYWFGGGRNGRFCWSDERKLIGHAVGVYASGGYYDFQWDKSGYQGEFLSAGVDYTFAAPISKGRLRMEFNIGFGYLYDRRWHYIPDDKYEHLIRDRELGLQHVHFFGPTRAGVSLVIPIYSKGKGKR